MRILILIIIVVLIACIFMAAKKKFKISEYDKLFNSINDMSYDKLDRIHEKLLPLCEEINFVVFPHADEYGNPVWDSSDEFIRKLNDKKSEELPVEKQIYGCKTFGDAEKLNQAIVKRLDELYEEQKS